jgi:hypothetical protein
MEESMLSCGLIGLIVALVLESANVEDITAEEAEGRANRANRIGAWLCGINLALAAISVVFFLVTTPRQSGVGQEHRRILRFRPLGALVAGRSVHGRHHLFQ